MGHLGNPTAFRLGIKKNWKFNFFVKNLYYSELFHNLINAKDYIAYYFSNKVRGINEDTIFFSHLSIQKILKKIYIKIYIYCVGLEKLSYNLINNLFREYYDAYNEIKNKFISDKDYRMNSFMISLNNADLAVFYITYIILYQTAYPMFGQAAADLEEEVEIDKLEAKWKAIDEGKPLDEDWNELLDEEQLKEKEEMDKKKEDELFIRLKRDSLEEGLSYRKKERKSYFLEKNDFLQNQNIKKLVVSSNYRYLKFLFSCLRKKWNVKTIDGFIKKEFRFTSYSKFYNTIPYNKWKKKLKKEFKQHFKSLKYSYDLWRSSKKYKKYKTYIKLQKKVKGYLNYVNDIWKSKKVHRKWKSNEVHKKAPNKKIYIGLNQLNKLFRTYLNRNNKKGKTQIINNRWIKNMWKYLKLKRKRVIKDKLLYLFRMWQNNKKSKKTSWLFNNNHKKNLRDMFCNNNKNRKYKSIDEVFNEVFDLYEVINTAKSCKQAKNTIKFGPYFLFMFLAQKVGFKKVKHSKSLKDKWAIMLSYIKLFYKFNIIDLRKNNSWLYDIRDFLFVMGIFIQCSRNKKKYKRKVRFNFRNSIHRTIHHGLYRFSTYRALEMKTNYLKLILTLLLNYKYDKNTITITYFFITNDSVTSQLIAYYIAIRLRKNLSIWKAIAPLKFELRRLAAKKKSRYSLARMKKYLYKSLWVRRIFLKNWLNRYISIFYTLKNIIHFKYYKENNTGGILITLNFFYNNLYYKKNKKRNKNTKRYLKWFKKFIIAITYANEQPNKIRFLQKFQNLKTYKINIIYPLLLSLNNKKWKINLYNNAYRNNAFYYVLKITHNIFMFKTSKLLNTKWIYIGSFFSKNYMNYGVVKELWLLFKKFNLRNFRQKTLSQYKTSFHGFKIVVKGRFSRKQRASKITWKRGKVPLNTADANIDYCFLTMPIKNSAISIKVYIYRSNRMQYIKNETF